MDVVRKCRKQTSVQASQDYLLQTILRYSRMSDGLTNYLTNYQQSRSDHQLRRIDTPHTLSSKKITFASIPP